MPGLMGDGGNGVLNNEVNEKLKSPNVHEKEDEYTAKMVMPVTVFKIFMGFLAGLSGLAFYLFHIQNFFNIGQYVPFWAYFVLPVLFVLSLIFLHPTPVDIWVPHVAGSRIGSSYCKLGLTCITLDYDVLNSKKDINKFIEEITDKSEDWNYFLKKMSPRNMTLKLKVRPKVKIPTKATLEGEYADNEMWNYIPLGICLTDSSILGSINWMLNDNNKVKGEHKETIPSTSFLVAGGTGSGKSVLENNIIRHCNKFSDNFQCMLVDVKRVEFGGLSNLEGIKAVALDIKEAEGCLRASREIMYSRFKFMEKSGVNNVYKLIDYKCSYYCIENIFSGVKKLFQFDEIFYSEVNSAVTITTIDNLYNNCKNDTVKIYFSGQKEKPLKISTDFDECKNDNGKETLYIREITPGDYYSFNNEIFYKDDILSVENKEMSAEKVFDEMSKGKTLTIDIKGSKVKANKDTFKCIECTFVPKAILTVVDEMSEVMGTNDYKAQASISDSISSIARLGRAAACHLCLATQRPSGNVISSDLKNNIQITTLLGGFGSSESTLCFDEDISDFCKPEIKGRGFVKTGNDIYEYQSFWIGEPKYIVKDKNFEKSDNDVPVIENTTAKSEDKEEIKESPDNSNSNNDGKNNEQNDRATLRRKRMEERRKRRESQEKKKEEQMESLIEKENSGEEIPLKRRRKSSWESEEDFKPSDTNEKEESKPKELNPILDDPDLSESFEGFLNDSENEKSEDSKPNDIIDESSLDFLFETTEEEKEVKNVIEERNEVARREIIEERDNPSKRKMSIKISKKPSEYTENLDNISENSEQIYNEDEEYNGIYDDREYDQEDDENSDLSDDPILKSILNSEPKKISKKVKISFNKK